MLVVLIICKTVYYIFVSYALILQSHCDYCSLHVIKQ